MRRVAIVEIGGSHDECILSQLIALKDAGAWIALCGTKPIFEKNSLFSEYVDEFYEVVFPKTMLGDFNEMRRLNKWFTKKKIETVIANTAQGGHIRNLCLTSSSSVRFFGIIHTIKMLNGSFTQSIISRKIKTYFVLNETLIQFTKKQKGIELHSFYPLSYPSFNESIEKPSNTTWIGIVGGVEFRRKDLTGFIKIAQLTPKNVSFIFLGKSNPFSEDVIKFKQLCKASAIEDRVVLFEDIVKERLFDAYLKQMDGIFPLVHPETPSSEEYFSRQISGAINIAFSYKIPMMIHEEYRNWEDFKNGVVFYNLSNFSEKMIEFLTQLSDLKTALKNNPKFSSDFQNQQFARVVLNNNL